MEKYTQMCKDVEQDGPPKQNNCRRKSFTKKISAKKIMLLLSFSKSVFLNKFL